MSPKPNALQQLVQISAALGYVRGVLEGQTTEAIRQNLRDRLWLAEKALGDLLGELEH